MTNQQVEEGETAFFSVGVRGSPQPEIKWYRDGVELGTDLRRSFGWDTKNKAHMKINHVCAPDAGKYRMVATNNVGSCACEAELKVLPYKHRQLERFVDVYSSSKLLK